MLLLNSTVQKHSFDVYMYLHGFLFGRIESRAQTVSAVCVVAVTDIMIAKITDA
jgi:hypothetical protein